MYKVLLQDKKGMELDREGDIIMPFSQSTDNLGRSTASWSDSRTRSERS